jgi:hypothetical protein
MLESGPDDRDDDEQEGSPISTYIVLCFCYCYRYGSSSVGMGELILFSCRWVEQSNSLVGNPGGMESSVYYRHPTIREICFLKRHFVSRMCRVKGNPLLSFTSHLLETQYLFRKQVSLLVG